ncbi:MAG: hypothetical protein ACI8RZ_000897 [Myxococcota bacterium]|jgi:hypothetical protein
MASGASTGGKVLTGCSCLSIFIFLALSTFIQFGLQIAYEMAPDQSQLWSLLGGPAALGFNACCCVSGVGLIVGVALLLMGRRSSGEDG